MSSEFKLGIQSYCFRKFLPLPELIEALKQAGLGYVEIWPDHIPYTNAESAQQKALDTLKENGISIDSYGQVIFTNDVAEMRKAFSFAQRAGIKAITADIESDAIQTTEALCEEFDINLAIHNHGRNHRFGGFRQLKELFSKTSKRFGLCLDTAWFLDAGEDPLAALDEFRGRIYGAHLKDFTFDKKGNHEDVIIGTGGLDLPEFMRRLKDQGFNGYLSLEYEGDADNPLPKVKECIEVFNEVMETLEAKVVS